MDGLTRQNEDYYDQRRNSRGYFNLFYTRKIQIFSPSPTVRIYTGVYSENEREREREYTQYIFYVTVRNVSPKSVLGSNLTNPTMSLSSFSQLECESAHSYWPIPSDWLLRLDYSS